MERPLLGRDEFSRRSRSTPDLSRNRKSSSQYFTWTVRALIRVSRSLASRSRRAYPSAVHLRNATPSVFHQRHIGRVLRSSSNHPGRRLASPRGREPRPGRCPPLWPGDLRNDRGSVAAADAGWARPEWMQPFARTIDAAKKYVVSNTLDRLDWNAELVRGDLGKAIQQLKRESGKGLFVGG